MTTLYEHGTLAALMAGNFDGTITVGDLLKHGSMGIGTFTGLDGEVVILNNEVYQAVSSGQVNHITDMDATMPFASVHFPAEQQDITLRNVNFAKLNNDFVKEHKLANVFAFLQLSGEFEHVKIRNCSETRKTIPDFTRCRATSILSLRLKIFPGPLSVIMHQKFLARLRQRAGIFILLAMIGNLLGTSWHLMLQN
jgi:alpha-acetolactate decarboxylase